MFFRTAGFSGFGLRNMESCSIIVSKGIYICIYIYTDRQTKNVTGDEVEARKSDKYVKSGVRLEEVQLMTVDRLEWSNFVSEREAPTRISTHSQARHSGFNPFMKELRPGSR